MIRKGMEIVADPDPTVRFEPPTGADFGTIDMPIPRMTSQTETGEFRRLVEKRVQGSCGNIVCKARVSITDTNVPAYNDDERIVQTLFIKCSDDAACPLRGPDGGTREPRDPTPEPPVLHAEIPLPINL